MHTHYDLSKHIKKYAMRFIFLVPKVVTFSRHYLGILVHPKVMRGRNATATKFEALGLHS